MTMTRLEALIQRRLEMSISLAIPGNAFRMNVVEWSDIGLMPAWNFHAASHCTIETKVTLRQCNVDMVQHGHVHACVYTAA